jgi:hypothetical protein
MKKTFTGRLDEISKRGDPKTKHGGTLMFSDQEYEEDLTSVKMEPLRNWVLKAT